MTPAPTGTPRTSRFAKVLLVPYLVFLGLIVWLPSDAAGRVTGIVATIADLVARYADVSFGSAYTVLEFLANIALFVPLGILVTLAWPRLRVWHVALLGFATSGLIEFVQIFLDTRFSTLSDLIANTAGAMLGCLLVRVAWMLRPQPLVLRPSKVEA